MKSRLFIRMGFGVADEKEPAKKPNRAKSVTFSDKRLEIYTTEKEDDETSK